MSDKAVSSSCGIGFFELLTMVFIVLKLTHCIDWSWWYVLMPLWLPVSLVLLIGLAVFVISMWVCSVTKD